MKQRFGYLFSRLAIVLICGIAYYIVFSEFGLALPCLFNKMTGLLCPSCGITRMIAEVVNGNFYEAFCYNKALFVLLPIIAIVFLNHGLRFVLCGKKNFSKFENCTLFIIAGVLLLFGIVRNIL